MDMASPSPADPDGLIDRTVRTALGGVALLVVVFGGAAAAIPIGGAVVASGTVGVESHVKRIAHPVGGTVAAVAVQNGSHVRAGQPLIRFDDKVSGADADLSALSVNQLLAQKARLEAEQLNAGTVAFPAELVRRSDPGAQAAIANERKMFAIGRAEQSGVRAQLVARVTQYRQQIAGFQTQIDANRHQIDLIKAERQGLSTLYDKGLVTLNRKNEVERQAIDYDGNIAALSTQIAQAQARISETREQLIQLDQTRRSDAGKQLAAVDATLNQQRARSVSTGDIQERTILRAPYAGVVDKLAFTTVGDVIRPAETIMEIVPDADRKVVEVTINPPDIDQVAVGQKARVRFTAFNGPTTPEVEGRILQLSADRSVDPETKRPFFTGRVAFDAKRLQHAGGFRIVAGMPAEVYIQTGSRSMLSYLLKPIRDQFQRAFTDNTR